MTTREYNPLTGIVIILGTFAVAALIAAAGREQARVEMVRPTAPLRIIVIATAQPTIVPTSAPIVIQSAPPTLEPPTPIIVEHVVERVIVQQMIVTATPAPPQLQTIEGGDEMSPALLREAQDQ